MTDKKTTTVYGDFNTREAADRAVEHLVQELGINRTDVFVQAKDSANTAGTVPSGGDASGILDAATRADAALNGPIEVSADIATSSMERVEQALRDAGALGLRAR